VLVGLTGGLVVWFYTLLLPSFADARLLPASFLREGPFGVEFLRPQALFGLDGMDPISNTMFWSALVNVGAFVGISLIARPDPAERAQATQFVDSLAEPPTPRRWLVPATVGQVRGLLKRFLGRSGAEQALRSYPGRYDPAATADPELVQHVETLLAGSVGAASARLVVASVAGEEQFRSNEVMELLDEASQVAALEERHRIARELHDSVSQALFSMTLHTRAAELALEKEGGDREGKAAQSLAELRNLTQGALAEMRGLIFQLRAEALHNDGLAVAVRKHATAVATWSGLDVNVDAPEQRLPLEERAEEGVYRVIQEALSNSVSHARARHIDVRLVYQADPAEPMPDGTLLVEITDDGIGFDPRAPRPGHHGLEGMRERVEELGGRFAVDSRRGSTTVRAVLPGILRQQLSGTEAR
jgi:signal transduction histidine kinase